MVAVAMIGVMVPSVTAETYNFKNLEDVSIDIPSSWILDERIDFQND